MPPEQKCTADCGQRRRRYHRQYPPHDTSKGMEVVDDASDRLTEPRGFPFINQRHSACKCGEITGSSSADAFTTGREIMEVNLKREQELPDWPRFAASFGEDE